MRATCTVPECDRTRDARGYCNMHYRRVKKHGDPSYIYVPQAAPTRYCQVDGCDRTEQARGYCAPHYQRWRRHGDPLAGGERRAHTQATPRGPQSDSLPAGPLLEYADQRGGIYVALTKRGMSHRTASRDRAAKLLHRARQTGRITAAAADLIAIEVFGTHPAMVYGDAWWLPEEMEDVA